MEAQVLTMLHIAEICLQLIMFFLGLKTIEKVAIGLGLACLLIASIVGLSIYFFCRRRNIDRGGTKHFKPLFLPLILHYIPAFTHCSSDLYFR